MHYRIKEWQFLSWGFPVVAMSTSSVYFSCSFKIFGLLDRVFTNGPGDLGLLPGRVILKTLKMVLDTPLLNTQQYKVRIKGKVEQFRERSSAPLHIGVVAIEKGAFWLLSTKVENLLTGSFN